MRYYCKYIILLIIISFGVCGCSHSVNKPNKTVIKTIIKDSETYVNTEEVINTNLDSANYTESLVSENNSHSNNKNNTYAKSEWITSKIKEEKENLYNNMICKNNIHICINNDELYIPFKGKDFTILKLVDNGEGLINNRSVSYGHLRQLVDNFDKAISVEYMNNTDNDLDRDECIVNHICSTSELVKLVIESDIDETEADIVTIGTSLDTIVEQFKKHGYEIYNVGSDELLIINKCFILTEDKNKGTWKIELQTYESEICKVEDSKYVPSDLKGKNMEAIHKYNFILNGTYDSGLNKIDIDYNILDVNELSYRYHMMNK